MSIKTEASVRRSAQVEAAFPGTPENVDQAIDTGPETSPWLAPARVVQRFAKLAFSLRALVTSVLLLIVLSSAFAQEAPKPSKELDHLKQLVGTWDADTESGKGTMTYKMGLGGLWLLGDFDGEFGGLKFQGKSMDSYDPAMKKYRSVWADSFTTSPRVMEGSLDKDGKVLTMNGDGCGADGKPTKFRSITEIKDADTVSFVLFMADKDGKEQQMVKIAYKRKK